MLYSEFSFFGMIGFGPATEFYFVPAQAYEV